MIVTASETKACVMNVITHDTAYSFFPWVTFEERLSLVCLDGDDIREKAFRKYSDRGWTFVTLNDLRRQKIRSPYLSFEVGREYNKEISARFVGDRRCWKVPLSPVLSLPNSYVENNSWVMDCGIWNKNPSMGFKFLVSRKLKFSYIVEADRSCDLADYISYRMGPCDWEGPTEPM